MTIMGNHEATAEQAETCDRHGDYASVLWSRPPPAAVPRPTGVKGVTRIADHIPGVLSNLWSFRSRCPGCDKEELAGQEQREKERDGSSAKDIAERRLAVTGIPRRFVESTLKNWDAGMDAQHTAKNWALSYCEKFYTALKDGRGAAFVGTPGTGKTHLAIGIMARVMEEGRSVHYTTVMDMLGRIKDTYHRDAKETETSVINALTKVDLLVIDEFGKSLDTNYEASQLFRIYDKRYVNMKPTILVSNLSVPEFKEEFGQASIDRLRENGGKVILFDWGSHRKRKVPPAEDVRTIVQGDAGR